jgi:hypothetical protein
MILDISQPTLNILTWSKVILFLYTFLTIFFIYKKKQPWLFMLLTTVVFVSFYSVLAWPLKTMWWGNVGDEMFVLGFLGKVLLGNPGHDFYYDWLPQFYPPLYFWVTGILSRPFASNAIVAAKAGITGMFILWFAGSYLWQKYFWQKVSQPVTEKTIESSAWFWCLLPALYIAMLDFDTVMLKPYECLPALFSVILIGFIARSFKDKHWSYKQYLFIGITGGLLFLIYYFWWIMLVPAILILALLSQDKWLNIKRTILFGLIILAVASVFVVPLLMSYIKYGLENGQAVHFIPEDFFTYVPWRHLSIQSLMYLAGLGGLLFFVKKSFIKANLITLFVAFAYQLFNYIYLLFGHRPMQSSKAFWFLGTAAVAVGLTYLLIYIYQKYISQWQPSFRLGALVFGFIILVTRFPFVYFIDDPVVLMQIEKDLQAPQNTIQLAEAIKINVPDYAERTWLSSGSMELSAYLPLSYYIAHNIHFSHHASNYSTRMVEIEKLSVATSPEEFIAIVEQGQPRQIDAMLLYHNTELDEVGDYPLWFWQDNFPNGGKDAEVRLQQNLIVEPYWQEVYNVNNWVIFIRK